MKPVISHAALVRRAVRLVCASSAAATLVPLFASLPSVGHAAEQSETQESLAEIVVTGSRIARPELEAPTPVTVLGEEAIQLGGIVNTADLVNELPGVAPGLNRQNSGYFTFGNAGLNCSNLRDLGIERTLVLMDGMRHTPSLTDANTPCVDLGNIPSALIERVEVITGGASAIYGADAVSGVINFITKKDFEGVEFGYQQGVSSRGDADSYSAQTTAGVNFEDGRGNAWVHFNYAQEEGLEFPDRDFASEGLTYIRNPAEAASPGNDPSIPDFIAQTGLGVTGFSARVPNLTLPLVRNSAGQLVRDDNAATLFTFNADGSLREFNLGGLSQPIDGFNVPLSGGDAGTGLETSNLTVPLKRYLLASGVRYDIHPKAQFTFDGKFSLVESSSRINSVFEIEGVNSPINVADNPFIPDDLRALLLGDPADPDDDITEIGVSREDVEFGRRGSDLKRFFWMVRTGFEGEFADGWNYEVKYQRGATITNNKVVNDRNDSRFFQALNAVRDPVTGEVVCRDPSEGCAPINIFGPHGSISQAAVDFIKVDHTTVSTFEQQVVTASVNGDVFELPAGMLKVAGGVEYREDDLDVDASTEFEKGLGFFNSTLPDVNGKINVKEVFGEVLVPVLRDLPGVESFNLEAAVRWADYSTAGENTSWKFGGDYAPVSDVRFRATYAQAVRAPNAGEIFQPAALGAVSVDDPCDELHVTSGSGNRAANCAALGITQPFVSNTRIITTLEQSTGNPDLDVETAKTLTVGAILQPRWVPDLTITADYWDIELSDGISDFSSQGILDNCVDFATINNDFCGLIARGADGNIAVIRNSLINVSSFNVSGVDIQVDYLWKLSTVNLPGSLRFNAIATHLEKSDFVLAPGTNAFGDVDPSAGEHGRPKWKGTLNTIYDSGPLTLSWQLRILDSTVRNALESNRAQLRSPYDTGTELYSDFQARYSFDRGLSLYAGANNVFDNEPPRNPDVRTGASRSGSNNIYDVIGRFYYAGATIKFE